MKRKIYAVAFALFSLTLLLIPSRLSVIPVKAINPPPPNYMTMTVDEAIGNFPATLDPANCYDSVSAELISNIYETLIAFDGESNDVFRPQLATQVTVTPPPLGAPPYTLYTIYFQIRTGVNFVGSCRTDYPLTWTIYPLTTADVEYSLERVMVHNYQGGPSWMLTEPLLSQHNVLPWMTTIIDQSVESNPTQVWINVANYALAGYVAAPFIPVNMFIGGGFNPNFWTSLAAVLPNTAPSMYDPKVLFQVLAQPWCSILSEQWILNYVNVYLPPHPGCAFADWDATWFTWSTYSGWASDQSPLDIYLPLSAPTPGMACGTGPYTLDTYDATAGWSCIRNTGYWGPWPAAGPSPPYQLGSSPPASSGTTPAGYVTRLTVTDTLAPAARAAALVSGACDLADIPRTRAPALHVSGIYSATLPLIRLNYPICSLKVESMHFTFNIASASGAYGTIGPPSTFSTTYIPLDFFSDNNIRVAFANLIDFSWIISTQMLGEAYQPITCCPNGLPYVDSPPSYGPTQNIVAATTAFKAAFGTLFWSGPGFSLTICYDIGNTVRAAIANKLAADLMTQIPWSMGFVATVTTLGVPWPSYVNAMKASELPLFFASSVPDYVDIQGYMLPYMGNGGGFQCGFAYDQGYQLSATDITNLDLAPRTPNGLARATYYSALELSYYNTVPSVPLFVPVERGYMRSWVAGHYYNALSHGIYAYDQWNWRYLRGNVNYDARVWIGDLSEACNAFGSYYGKSGMPVIQARWDFNCDVDGNPYDANPPGEGGWRDRKIDMYDITELLAHCGQVEPTVWHP